MSGESVTFSVSPDDGIASLSTTSATTDSNGQAQTTLSLADDSSESHYQVTAKLTKGQGNVPAEWVPVGGCVGWCQAGAVHKSSAHLQSR